MKSKWINDVTVRGYVFGYDRLGVRTGNKGNYISGVLKIATDDKALNVVHVDVFASELRKDGKPNTTYQFLLKLIDGTYQTYERVGVEAVRVRIVGSIDVNDWIGQDGEMKNARRVRGSLIFVLNPGDVIGDSPATFENEVVIERISEHENDTESYVTLHAWTFKYNGDIIPVTFDVKTKSGIDFFVSQDISPKNPMVIRVWGGIVTNVIQSVREADDTDVAFGSKAAASTAKSIQSWVVEGASNPMEFGSEDVVTVDDIKNALAARENHLSDVRLKATTKNAPQPKFDKPKPGRGNISMSNYTDKDDDYIPF